MASSLTPTATYRPAHVLSKKSSRQHRNVFIWCTVRDKVALGWRVGDDSPVTISTAYRWITTAVEAQSPGWKDINSFTLCPVHVRPSGVLTYCVRQNGAALPRESHDTIAPGDYGVYTIGADTLSCSDDSDPRLYFRFDPEFSFASMEIAVEMNSPSLLTKLSNERNSMGRYFAKPETCDLSELMVIENVICGRKDIIALFWENKLGVDVDDNRRIVVFEGSESLNNGTPLKTHLTRSHGSDGPNDSFLRLHFKECLSVSVCLGDVREDYEEQEIEIFMEDLGVYDNEIDPSREWQALPVYSERNFQCLRLLVGRHISKVTKAFLWRKFHSRTVGVEQIPDIDKSRPMTGCSSAMEGSDRYDRLSSLSALKYQ
ncbi:hypothetical protein AGABI1DRAFT_108282 [Agaricus bisporus var. burnettii JB137-S8]|uniref:Uncharacterized protein n=1 Tax=Agaricus bisporus var. burnettii (strain JB137-S8 / ATCC MYA-4627 / FGSC 10392) TaxID=597362 RepID=K5X1Y4_AGABU|nr:uncharacterized protein AGABI1DRAFT_108282 [Agaricus bisporus var. burnettii JB137-S8]EKM77133.1 hypothetical protein AGABI1DRAFT_108282 [Agaricus bisporus var. burnettii JB137-S8]